MTELSDEFFALEPDQRRVVHIALCEHALRKWRQYANTQGRIRYSETVCGTRQQVDNQLPADALESVKQGADPERIRARYLEPIVAMQDEDLEFPENVEFAYYAIYNLFRKYSLGQDIDDWMIVNQAISSENDSEHWRGLLSNAIERATQHGSG